MINKRIDYLLILLTIFLISIGLLIVFTRTQDKGLFYKQLIILGISLVVCIIIYFIDVLKVIKENINIMLIVTFILLLLPIIFRKSLTLNGSVRWIKIGPLSFQPSELAKLVLVCFLANNFSKKTNRVFDFYDDLLYPMFISFIILGLIYLQKDLSTVVLTFTFVLVSFYIAQVPILHILYLAGFSLSFFIISAVTSSYRASRLVAYLVPFDHPSDDGFQVIQSFKSIGAGKFMGQGLGETISKGDHLPLSYSDYIFSSIVKDGGLLLGFIVITVFILWCFRGFYIASKQSDRFKFLLATYISLIIALQALINISVATGLLPPTGLTLPFVSYGGSSMLITIIFVALLLKINKEGSYEV